MRKHYLAGCLMTALLFINLHARCQELEFLNSNNVNAGIGIGGNLFSRLNDTASGLPMDTIDRFALFEAPKGTNIRSDYTSALWMNGFDTGGNLHGMAQTYRRTGGDYSDGPISTVYDSQYDNYYNRVFKITRQQISHHLTLSFPVSVSQIDSSLLKWPGKGNPYVASTYGVNISTKLAPFIDVDADGIYDPTKGDYPAFCGDEAIFFVFNDVRRSHSESDCTPLGFEIRGLAEVFLSNALPFEKQAINNTVFVSYEVENKSSNPYFQFYLGKFEDPDLGCFSNDRIGCDSLKNLMFVYNGEAIDFDCQGVEGYGTKRASFGVKFLNTPMSYFSYETAGNSDSDLCLQFRNNITGYSNDSAGVQEPRYVFPGDPNDTTGWSEVTAGIPMGDRRMVSSTGPMTFLVGETKYFDFAFIASYDTSGTNFTIVDTLKRDADVVQQFYNHQYVPCKNQLTATGIQPLTDDLSVNVFPMPAHGAMMVSCEQNITALELYDMLGRLVVSQKPDNKLNVMDVSAVSRGIYLLKIRANEKEIVRKVDLQ